MTANLFRGVDRAVEYALFLIFLAFTLVGGLQVFNRFVLGLPLSWSEEFQKFGHIWMVMLAIPVAYRRGAHLGMDMLLRMLPKGAQRIVGAPDRAPVARPCARHRSLHAGHHAGRAKNQDSPGLGIPMDYVYLGMVIGSTYLAFVALRRLATYFGWNDPPPEVSEWSN